ncbi:MAG: hypothetical protein CM1200mP41_08690 [Gammaproteobacteria bacterium]|nr:MAG: hypothetical protein CM1200mP41_08690 [Gammaproteobacteria bacterium]
MPTAEYAEKLLAIDLMLARKVGQCIKNGASKPVRLTRLVHVYRVVAQ